MTSESCLVTWRGQTLDVGPFLPLHPGGANALRQMQGKDVTRLFGQIGHSEYAATLAASYAVGQAADDAPADVVTVEEPEPRPDEGLLEPVPRQLPGEVTGAGIVEELLTSQRRTTEMMLEKMRNWNASRNLRGYGSRWHDDRRRRIYAKHGEHIKQLVGEHPYFAFTLPMGLVGAFLHLWIAAVWIPSVCVTVFQPVGIAEDPVGLLAHVLKYLSPVSIMSSWAAASQSQWQMWGTLVLTAFLYAYCFGAVCKMLSFGVGHEIAHEAVHPWLTIGAAAGADTQRHDWWWFARAAMKDISLRLCTLPSVDHAIFEYYQNQHLAHHRFLGSQDISDALTGIVNGSQMGDGDQFAVVGLQQHQRQIRHLHHHIPLDDGPESIDDTLAAGLGFVAAYGTTNITDEESLAAAHEEVQRIRSSGSFATAPEGMRATVRFSRLMAHFEGANWDSFNNVSTDTHWLPRWMLKHQTIGKVLLDPIFHVGHWGMANMTMLINLLALAGFIPGMILGYVLPERCYTAVSSRTKHLPSHNMLRQGLSELWPLASVGIQTVVKAVVLVATYHSIAAQVAVVPAVAPLAVFALVVVYLVLSELFVFGFLFHPFLAYFLTVHHSAYDHARLQLPTEDPSNPTAPPQLATESGKPIVRLLNGSKDSTDSSTGYCQPTRSMYGSRLFSLLTMNLTHHVEHHDFPSVPWFYLPTITRIAPEFYKPGGTVDGEPNGVVAANNDPISVIYDYLTREPQQTVYGCGNCT